MPLMNRTVREESGASSLLKKAPVRASATARSAVGIIAPKFPNDVGGADGPTYTARIRPMRSTTAMAMASDGAAVAAASTTICTSACDKVSVAGGGPGGNATPTPPPLLPLPPPPHAPSIRQNATPRQTRRLIGLHGRVRTVCFAARIIEFGLLVPQPHIVLNHSANQLCNRD